MEDRMKHTASIFPDACPVRFPIAPAVSYRRRDLSRRISGLSIMLLLSWAGLGLAQSVDSVLVATNGSIYSILPDGNTIYVGGRFTQVGSAARITGHGAAIDASTGDPRPRAPQVT